MQAEQKSMTKMEQFHHQRDVLKKELKTTGKINTSDYTRQCYELQKREMALLEEFGEKRDILGPLALQIRKLHEQGKEAECEPLIVEQKKHQARVREIHAERDKIGKELETLTIRHLVAEQLEEVLANLKAEGTEPEPEKESKKRSSSSSSDPQPPTKKRRCKHRCRDKLNCKHACCH